MAQPYLAPKMVLTSMQVSWELPSTTSSTAPGPSSLLPFLLVWQAVRHHKPAFLQFHCLTSSTPFAPGRHQGRLPQIGGTTLISAESGPQPDLCIAAQTGCSAGISSPLMPVQMWALGTKVARQACRASPACCGLHDLLLAARVTHNLAAAVRLIPCMAAQNQEGGACGPGMACRCIRLQPSPTPVTMSRSACSQQLRLLDRAAGCTVTPGQQLYPLRARAGQHTPVEGASGACLRCSSKYRPMQALCSNVGSARGQACAPLSVPHRRLKTAESDTLLSDLLQAGLVPSNAACPLEAACLDRGLTTKGR